MMPADSVRETLQAAREQGLPSLEEPVGKAILDALGITVPVSRVLAVDETSAGSLEGMTGPFALKLIAREVIHKSDVGGVRLGLKTADDVDTEIEALRRHCAVSGIDVRGWLIEEMAEPGVEVVVGGLINPEFGPMVMVGLGGIFVEVLRDVAFRICPILEHDAHDMLRELRGAPLLAGARGRQAVSVDAIVDVLLKLAGKQGLLWRYADYLAEVDINPLIVSGSAAVAVDARILLRPDTTRPRVRAHEPERTAVAM